MLESIRNALCVCCVTGGFVTTGTHVALFSVDLCHVVDLIGCDLKLYCGVYFDGNFKSFLELRCSK